MVENMVKEFYRDSPEYQYKEAKYVWYFELFPDVDNQEQRILGQGSNGYGVDEYLEQYPNTPIPKEYFVYDYYVDGTKQLSVKKAVVTIIADGYDPVSYDTLNDPEVIRLSFDDACVMGLEDRIVKFEDGTPDVESTPSFHSVKCIFNEFPSDEITYIIQIIDANGNVAITDEGVIRLVAAPWDEE